MEARSLFQTLDFMTETKATNKSDMQSMQIEALLDYKKILANQPQPVCFALRLRAPETTSKRTNPAAFCLVLDRSGSMSGKPIAKAREAATMAVRHLRAEDEVSIVLFDREAQVLVPLKKAQNKASILQAISTIQEQGNTNLAGGWMLGRDELKKAPPGCTRRLFLLSDGQLNAGITEPARVSALTAAGLEMDQIRTSCLGFGENYNEDLMAEMARVTNGQFYDADSPEKFPAIFQSELDGLQNTVVQNARVRIRKLEFCEKIECLGTAPAIDLPDARTEFALGDLVSGEERIITFEMAVLALPLIGGKPAFTSEGERLIEIELLWDEVTEKSVISRVYQQVIRIQATQNPDEIETSAEVITWVALQKAGKVLNDVTLKLDAGQVASAISEIKKSISALKAYDSPEATQEAIQQLIQLQTMLEKGAWSAQERKSSRYRSHSYGKMSSHEHWSGSTSKPSFKKK
jgi:Ca-activated chloride channel family protein